MCEAGGRPPALKASFGGRQRSGRGSLGKIGAAGVPMPAIPEMSAVWADWGATELALIKGQGDPAADSAKMAPASRPRSRVSPRAVPADPVEGPRHRAGPGGAESMPPRPVPAPPSFLPRTEHSHDRHRTPPGRRFCPGSSRRPRQDARRETNGSRRRTFGPDTTKGTVAKIVLLGASWMPSPFYVLMMLFLASPGARWSFPAVVVAAINWIYLRKGGLPAKYLAPGVLFLLVFQVFVVLFSGYIAFTNYGDGHNSTKDDAIAAIQLTAQKRVPDSPRL